MSQTILVNEIGYLPGDPKRAIYRGEGETEFSVIEKNSGNVVFRGKSDYCKETKAAGETDRVLAFDEVKEEGEY